MTRDEIGREQSANFGSEEKKPVAFVVIKRLDAEAVARREDRAALIVAQRKGEHALQKLQTVFAVPLVKVQQNFRIGVGGKARAVGFQSRAQLQVVINLAV